jgi:hypothetical protein
MFRNKAIKLFKIEEVQEVEVDVRGIANQIRAEIKELPTNTDT